MKLSDRARGRDYGRDIANLVAVSVGGVAGYLSWRHLNDLGLRSGLDATSAALSAIPIDGMIVVGTLQLRAARRAEHPAHWSAYLCVIAGVLATVAGNIAAAPPNVWARILHAGPPVAFLLSIEALFGKPLTRNLWDILRGWTRRAPSAAAAPKPEPVPQKTIPVPPVQHPAKPVVVQPAKPAEPGPADDPQPRPQGVHVRDGKALRGPELKADALDQMLASVSPDRPSGMTNGELARLYAPPLKPRLAETFGAEARKAISARGNGHAASALVS